VLVPFVLGILAIGVPAWVSYGGVWCIAAVLLLRAMGDFRYAGLTKTIRNTSFARKDTRIYTPFCLVMAALCIVIQVL
jgi:hypothetical protein